MSRLAVGRISSLSGIGAAIEKAFDELLLYAWCPPITKSDWSVWYVLSQPNREDHDLRAGAVAWRLLNRPDHNGMGDEPAVGHVAALLPI